MSDELADRPQAAVDATAADWARHHAREAHLASIIDRAQRFAEVLHDDEDAVRRAVAAELIEIIGVPL